MDTMKRPVEVILRGGQFKQLTEQELSELRKNMISKE